MFNKLRRRFILIAMCSVSLVIVFVSLSVNLINFLSINSDLSNMLEMICENQGMVPDFPRGGRQGDGMRGLPITPETPFSTRYFVLYYNADGALTNANMRHIAAVTEDGVDAYLSIALDHGEGFGYADSYKYYVTSTDNGGYMAVFLECQQELRSVKMFGLASLLVVVCIGLVYLLVIVFSKRAIDPVVKSVEKQKQFITNASHELKTPLTVITTCLKVLEMEVASRNGSARRRPRQRK